eukprot:gene14163-2510_t
MVNQATAIETRLERSYLSQYEERAASSGGGRRSAAAAPRSPDSRRMRAEFQASQAGARSRSGRPIASNPNRMADEEFCELFGEKAVNELSCKYCCSDLSRRGMRALLLADHAVELFSTDGEPRGCALVGNSFSTDQCNCCISDVCCLGCGNSVGYHVLAPCEKCMSQKNNGHFWMFHGYAVSSHGRSHTDRLGRQSLLTWRSIPSLHEDVRQFHDSMRTHTVASPQCAR